MDHSTFWGIYGSSIAQFLGIIISASVAIILFNKGLKKERDRIQKNWDRQTQKEINKENEKINALRKHILVLLDSITNTVEKQCNEYVKKSNEILKNPTNILTFSNFTKENIKRLLSFDPQNIWNVFSNYSIKNDYYIKFYSSLDYLNIVFEKIEDDVNNGNGKTVYEFMNNLIVIRNNLLNVISDYINIEKARNSSYKENNLWNFLNKIVLDYYSNNDGIPDIEKDYNELFLPLKHKLLKDEYRYHTISNEVLILCKKGGDIHFTIKQINEALASDILKTTENIKEQNKSLKEIIKNLGN